MQSSSFSSSLSSSSLAAAAAAAPQGLSEKRGALCFQHGGKEADEIEMFAVAVYSSQGVLDTKRTGSITRQETFWVHVVSHQQQTRNEILKQVYLHMSESSH
jgi:hypothetical protein